MEELKQYFLLWWNADKKIKIISAAVVLILIYLRGGIYVKAVYRKLTIRRGDSCHPPHGQNPKKT